MIVVILLLTLFSYLLYAAATRKNNYWKNKKVPFSTPKFLFGNYREYILQKKILGECAQDICRQFTKEPYIGSFYGTEPALLIQDPDLLKLVFRKDFYYFSSREVSKYTDKELTTQNLFFTYGDRWKVLRQNMTPIFTSAKMKNMFYLVNNCCHALEQLLDQEVTASNVIEVRALASRYTMECISSCAFGIDIDTMKEDGKNNPFFKIGNTIFSRSTYRGIMWIWRVMWPFGFYGLGFKAFPTDIDKFFGTLLTKVFEGRNYKPTPRNDFVDCMLNLKLNKYITGDCLTNQKASDSKKVHIKVDTDLLVSLCVELFGTGFETSSTTMSYVMFELAKDKEAQRNVQEEIDEYLRVRDNKLGYDCVNSLPFTEACVDEILRLYPVAALLTREVVEDYTFPSGLTLEKDVRVHIPVYHIHRDPNNFPDPETFRPERFLGEEKKNIKPFTYIPFGEGPRICIGMRFAKMQMMAGLVTVFKKYNVELAEGTPEKCELEPRSIGTTPRCGLVLKFTEREGWQQRIFAK